MEETLEIENFSKKGWGVGRRPSGSLVEVPHSVVGDEVRVLLKARKKRGQLLSVIQASQDRVTPPCPHAGICGGCTWQQLAYPKQLAYKQRLIQELFGEYPSAAIYPIIPAENIFTYRNKMEFSFGQNAGGAKYLGLMIAGAAQFVFNVDQCHLGRPWFSFVLEKVRAWFVGSTETAWTPKRPEGTLRTLTLREGVHTGERLALLTGNCKDAPQGFLSALQSEVPHVVYRRQNASRGVPSTFSESILQGKGYIWESLDLFGKTYFFKVSASAFFQPNTRQATLLYEKALSFIQEGDFVCDLYSGTGTLACLAASRARFVVAIEQNPDAVLDARENFARNGKTNIEIHEESVGDTLHKWPRVDMAFLDPPRAGLDQKALRFLHSLLPQKIVYISCNPRTQKEDIIQLVSMGYIIERVQPIDQFPHTYHIENIAFLVRKTEEKK